MLHVNRNFKSKEVPKFLIFIVLIGLIILYVSKVDVYYNNSPQVIIVAKPEIKGENLLKNIKKCLSEVSNHIHLSRGEWPDAKFNYLERCQSGSVYNLQIRPKVLPGSKTNAQILKEKINEIKHISKTKANFTNSSKLFNYFHLLTNVNLGGARSQHYDIYPQIIDLNEVYTNISSGRPVRQMPMNDPNMFVLRVPDKVCDAGMSHKLDLLIIVKSIALNFDTRNALRKHYAQFSAKSLNFNYKVIFNTALPYSETGRTMQFKYVNSTLGGRAGDCLDKYQKNGSHLTKQLFEEASLYDDLLIGGTYDSYYNLTTKVITSFRWASVYCHNSVSLYLFTDDDMIVNVENTAKLVKNLSLFEKDHLSGGFMFDSKQVTRPSKDPRNNRWALHENEYPWTRFPPYYSGIAFFIGPKVLNRMAVASAFVEYNRIDDTFIGLLLYKLSIVPKNIFGIALSPYKNYKSELLIAGLK